MYIDDSVRRISAFEGRINHFYLDTKANVTIGVGELVASVKDALTLPLLVMEGRGSRPATEAEISFDWKRVKQSTPGFMAAYYHWPKSTILTDESMDKLLRDFVVKVDAELPPLFPNYATWPDEAKLAMLDMGYNMGTHKLGPHMSKYLRAGDFAGAATETHRKDVSDARNAWTKLMMQEAAQKAASATKMELAS